MNWKVRQLKREDDNMSATHNLTVDSIGWFIPNYHTDKIMKDILFNATKKIYVSENPEYITKLLRLPDKYEAAEKIEEFEIMFAAVEKRSKK